jgi:hypothetical protein
MSRKNRVRKLINLGIKKEIIFKQKSAGDLSAEYGMAKSTISTISFFIFFTKERLFMLFKLTRTSLYFSDRAS